MKNKLPIAAAAALFALSSCAVGVDGPVPADARGDAAASEALAGRTAGTPVSCVRQQDVRNSRSGSGGTILFDGPGDLVYVNRPRSECPAIRSHYAISHRTTGTNLCTGDLIRIYDPTSGIEYGGCSLGEFEPWRRPR